MTDSTGSVEIGETHVRVVPPYSTIARVAVILERITDPKSGAVQEVVLDRKVLESYHERVGEWKASGPYVTILTRSGGRS